MDQGGSPPSPAGSQEHGPVFKKPRSAEGPTGSGVRGARSSSPAPSPESPRGGSPSASGSKRPSPLPRQEDGSQARAAQALQNALASPQALSHLSPDQLKAADLDGDGVITARELRLFQMAVDASVRSAAGIAMTQNVLRNQAPPSRAFGMNTRVVRAQAYRPRQAYARSRFSRFSRTRSVYRARRRF